MVQIQLKKITQPPSKKQNQPQNISVYKDLRISQIDKIKWRNGVVQKNGVGEMGKPNMGEMGFGGGVGSVVELWVVVCGGYMAGDNAETSAVGAKDGGGGLTAQGKVMGSDRDVT